jgi:hypothetical protein
VLPLLLAILVPVFALGMATRLRAGTSPAELLARRVALLAVAAPPLFTLMGVMFLLLGHPTWDTSFMTLLWGALMLRTATASRVPAPLPAPSSSAARWRTAHGVAALLAVLFLASHFSNHLFGLLGPDMHAAVMKVLRTVYRSAVIEPLLIATFAFLIASGAGMAWRLTARPMDAFRTFQVAAGVFLIFAVTSHVSAVLYLARIHFGIDTDWAFATGAPAGMLNDAWNIRLLPYYLWAVFFVIAHAFSGLRIILLTHGTQARTANRALFGGAMFAAVIATVIILAMCGLRLA